MWSPALRCPTARHRWVPPPNILRVCCLPSLLASASFQGGGCSTASAPAGAACNQPWVRLQPSWTWKDMTSYCLSEDLHNTAGVLALLVNECEKDVSTVQTNSLEFWLDFVAVFFQYLPYFK